MLKTKGLREASEEDRGRRHRVGWMRDTLSGKNEEERGGGEGEVRG